MRKSRLVWLPPRGDCRLLRYQEKLARLVGAPFQVFPPFLTGEGDWLSEFPLQEIRLGEWTFREEGPVLAGPLPGLFFWMGWEGEVPREAPPVPSLVWTRGQTALFTWETPEPGVLFWSFSSWRPWRPRVS